MTRSQAYYKKRHKPSKLTKLAFSYMTVFVLILFFKNSTAAAQWVRSGLLLCATRLIPSLFPFMVLSSLMVTSGAGASVFKLLSKPFRLLFGLCEHGTSALILGWLCGFPVGAKCAYDLLRDGKIGDREYKIILCSSSTPSPAFVIGTLGKGMLGDSTKGIALYALSIAVSTLIGIFMNVILKKEGEQSNTPTPPGTAPTFAAALTHSIVEAGMGMLNVCAFVVFFSAFLGVLEGVLHMFAISEQVMAVIFCFFEITSGLARVSALPHPLPLCALAVGWSGLSVHFQTMSICQGTKHSFAPFVLAQAVKALLCFFTVLIAC